MTVNLDKSGGCEVLELNIQLPDVALSVTAQPSQPALAQS